MVGQAVTEERWLPIVGWEDFYEVSDLGRIRTVPRRVPCKGGKTRQLNQRIRRPSLTNCGYLTITLCADGLIQHRTVHPIVLEAFVGPRPPGMECCHNDGNKANNALSNLRWDTKKANELDAIRIGKRPDPNRTRCNYGHELTDANIYFSKAKPNIRQCKECLRIYNARGKAKRKLRNNAGNLSQAEWSSLYGAESASRRIEVH